MRKSLFLVAMVVLLAVIVSGCSLFGGQKTYSLESFGVCVEVTTSDKDVQDAAEAAGYSEGPCPTDGALGTCEDYVSIEGESFSATYYEELGDASAAETACEAIGGTWSAN